MGMTMTQKILAAHAGLESVTAGQLIEAKLDIVMANDITGPMALPILKQIKRRLYLYRIISPRTKTSNPQRIQKRSVNLQKNRD